MRIKNKQTVTHVMQCDKLFGESIRNVNSQIFEYDQASFSSV